MSSLRKALVVVLLVLGVAYFVLRKDDPSTGLTLYDPDQPPPPVSTPVEPVEVRPGDPDAILQPSEPHLLPATVRGRVLGVDGEPIAGVAILQKHPILTAGPVDSGTDGSFELRVDEPRGELVLESPGWLLLGGQRHLTEGKEDGYTVVIAPTATVSGSVADESGQALADVALRVLPPGDTLVRLGSVAPPIVHESQSGWSDAAGHFRIGPVPRVNGLRIEATVAGFLPATVPISDDLAPVSVVLTRRE